MRLCKDCAFFLPDCDAKDPHRYARCENDETGTVNPVSGAHELGVCSVERSTFGKCLPEGRLFVERQAFAEADRIADPTATALTHGA